MTAEGGGTPPCGQTAKKIAVFEKKVLHSAKAYGIIAGR